MKSTRVTTASADADVVRLAKLTLALTVRVEKLERELERLRHARLIEELTPQCWRKL
ncbi:MAG: hypothetical protein LBD30_07945 [Verrucomicrobiales bacterium]|jgi:hypothetical protein|nr:hypothetical protein [Verrucomicrobiales bacterium]